MASRNKHPTSGPEKVIFWTSFALTSAALAVAGVIVWKAIQGPGAPDMTPHFAGAAVPAAEEEEEETGDAALTDQEREHLDEILRQRATTKPAQR